MGKVTKEKFKVLNGVFDEFTLNTLENLKRRKYYDEFGKAIKTGKEGDVYLAFKEEDFRAVKIFRLTTANFKKISTYINRDFRFKTIKGNLRKVILTWTQKEFRNLLISHKVGINVPFPFKQLNNVIVMEYIEGDMLKDVKLENPKDFFEKLLFQINTLVNKAQLVHGDLSEFNILVKEEEPYLIDFGQAMSIKNEEDFLVFYDLYERDIKNIIFYFNKQYKLDLNFEEILNQIKKKPQKTKKLEKDFFD